jgi:hypothetical protein
MFRIDRLLPTPHLDMPENVSSLFIDKPMQIGESEDCWKEAADA